MRNASDSTPRGIFPGRYTARIEGGFVVFLIGMRVNRPWRVHRWMPVMAAMPRLLRELHQSPNSGFLGGQVFFSLRQPIVVQYWDSFEKLVRYSRSRDSSHWPAWKAFRQTIGDSGEVGIWHETYLVEPGRYECIYGNMPAWGLATCRGVRHVPISSGLDTADQRAGVTSVTAGSPGRPDELSARTGRAPTESETI